MVNLNLPRCTSITYGFLDQAKITRTMLTIFWSRSLKVLDLFCLFLQKNEWIRIKWLEVAPICFVILLSDARQVTKIILYVLSIKFSVEG